MVIMIESKHLLMIMIAQFIHHNQLVELLMRVVKFLMEVDPEINHHSSERMMITEVNPKMNPWKRKKSEISSSLLGKKYLSLPNIEKSFLIISERQS